MTGYYCIGPNSVPKIESIWMHEGDHGVMDDVGDMDDLYGSDDEHEHSHNDDDGKDKKKVGKKEKKREKKKHKH